jgi:hypothetical protein
MDTLPDHLLSFLELARSPAAWAKANALWRRLQPLLPKKDRDAIETAWALVDEEGSDALEHAIRRVVNSTKQ